MEFGFCYCSFKNFKINSIDYYCEITDSKFICQTKKAMDGIYPANRRILPILMLFSSQINFRR